MRHQLMFYQHGWMSNKSEISTNHVSRAEGGLAPRSSGIDRRKSKRDRWGTVAELAVHIVPCMALYTLSSYINGEAQLVYL